MFYPAEFKNISRALKELNTGHDWRERIDDTGLLKVFCLRCHAFVDCTMLKAADAFELIASVPNCRGEPLGKMNFFIYKRKTIRELLETK